MLSSLSLYLCALVCGVFWRVYIYRRERVGLSSRSRFPAFVFCFISCVSATLVLKRAAPKSGLLCHFFCGGGGGGVHYACANPGF